MATPARPHPQSLSPEGLEALKRREGTRYHYYNDHPRDGNCTWGTGFLAHMGPCTTEETGRAITQVEIDAELRRRASHAEELVTRNLREPVSQQQFDALVSFAYNTGLAVQGVIARVNAGDSKGAAELIRQSVTAQIRHGRTIRHVVLPGLITRRAEESRPFIERGAAR